jgi:hypothetical protein
LDNDEERKKESLFSLAMFLDRIRPQWKPLKVWSHVASSKTEVIASIGSPHQYSSQVRSADLGSVLMFKSKRMKRKI